MSDINVTVGTNDINITVGSNPINITLSGDVNTTNSYIDEDELFRFSGVAGDTYLKYNSSTNRLELWVNGSKVQEWD